MLKPCLNNGSCYNNVTVVNGYICTCPHGFDGAQCELDNRLCKPNTCWNDGIHFFSLIFNKIKFLFLLTGVCNETSNTTFHCLCKPGWEGEHCETKTNYCQNITCENNGVCRPLFMNYTCECLGESYSGRHCEIISNQMIIRQTITKSLSYIAIIALTIVAMFIVVMDILKYCFGIDPVQEERDRLRKNKKIQKRKPVIQKFVYVNASTEQPTANEQETAV